MGTPYLINPSLQEVLLQAAKIGLPNREAEKFWNHYESVGWRRGRNKICSWTHALSGWKLRWQEAGGTMRPPIERPLDQDLRHLLGGINGHARRYAP